MADNNEINIYIRNTVDVTNVNATPQATATTKPVKAASSNNKKSKDDELELFGLKAERWTKIGFQLANSVGVDVGDISQLADYGFATSKAIAGLMAEEIDYRGLIQLLVKVAVSTIREIRKAAQEKATTLNAIDQARIEAGLLDISDTRAKVSNWSGRVTYNALNRK